MLTINMRVMLLHHSKVILAFVMLLIVHEATAQDIDRMRGNLATSGLNSTRILVTEDSSTHEAITAVEAKARPKQVNGYRIVIYSDNGQYAGDNAEEVLNTFKSQYPYINAYLVYESPYFKVSVGDCLTMDEAQILMARLLGNYPKAFPKREVIKLSELRVVRREADIVADTLRTDSLEIKAPRVEYSESGANL